MDYDVVIAGAGPVGLLLACELRLAGVSVLVFEKLEDPNLPIKAGPVGGRALNIPSMEVFYRRGLLPAVKKLALKWADASMTLEGLEAAVRGVAPSLDSEASSKPAEIPPRFGSSFGTMLDANVVDYSDPEFAGRGPAAAYGVITMQSLETLLGKRAADLQAEIRRGTSLTHFSADASGVTVHAGDTTVRSGWLVGCDGGRSRVRKLAGFEFPGTDPEISGYSAMVEIADPEKLSFGWKRTAKGAYVNGPMSGRILTVEFDGPPKDRDAPITLDELQASLRKVSGTDATLTAVHAATRWTDNARQASTYRLGRVLLAGDAAHVFAPIGGEGLNLGIGDAVNLGWKLAATVNGWGSEMLLDTYTTERHLIGAWALKWATAQVALMGPKRHRRARISVLTELGRGGATSLAKKVSGVWQRYELPGDHPLVGRSAPDFEFEDGRRLGEYCLDGCALLFDFVDDARISMLAARWRGRLNVITTRLKEKSDLTALFVRPDGFVAWAANRELDLENAASALSMWLGNSE
ncbi:MAG: FAD-dependent monooxygenase [Alloacidobacterium sp.]|jgi:2-polyprenyl-6-methoxyphenol hydroxylase-like FAD-dependent oxidoreductase